MADNSGLELQPMLDEALAAAAAAGDLRALDDVRVRYLGKGGRLTEQLKRATLTNAKTFMLLRYAGLALPDYYACMLTDAYGNFGRAGFVLVAAVLGGLAAFVGWGLGTAASPALALLACFWAVRALPFEQEFVSLLTSWVKLLPVLVLVILARPLRRVEPAAG